MYLSETDAKQPISSLELIHQLTNHNETDNHKKGSNHSPHYTDIDACEEGARTIQPLKYNAKVNIEKQTIKHRLYHILPVK